MANKDDGNDDDKIGNLKDVGTTKIFSRGNKKSNTIASIFWSVEKNVTVIIVSYYLLYCVFFRVTACIHYSSTVLVYSLRGYSFSYSYAFSSLFRKRFEYCLTFCLYVFVSVFFLSYVFWCATIQSDCKACCASYRTSGSTCNKFARNCLQSFEISCCQTFLLVLLVVVVVVVVGM